MGKRRLSLIPLLSLGMKRCFIDFFHELDSHNETYKKTFKESQEKPREEILRKGFTLTISSLVSMKSGMSRELVQVYGCPSLLVLGAPCV